MHIYYDRALYRARLRIRESNLLILSDLAEGVVQASSTIRIQRSLLEAYLKKDPRFRYALKPIRPLEDAPQSAKMACSAAEVVSVGPMAALPGALADLAVKEMERIGCRVRVVENGGEVSAASNRDVSVALYAGRNPLSFKIGLLLGSDCLPAGLATSSATVSHALSFGEADAVLVYAGCAALADAAATRICNAVSGADDETAVQRGLEEADRVDGIYGLLVVKGRYVGKKGRLPKIVRIKGLESEVQEAAYLHH